MGFSRAVWMPWSLLWGSPPQCLNHRKTLPITLALNNLVGSQIVEWNVQMAGALKG